MLVLNKTPNLINFTYNDFADKLKQFLVKYDCPEFILFPSNNALILTMYSTPSTTFLSSNLLPFKT